MLKHISRIGVKFYPLSPQTTTARAFYQMVSNERAAMSNEACSTSLQLLPRHAPATISIEWEDKTKMELDATALKLPEVLERIETKRKSIVLLKIMREIKAEYEPETDPFEEARQEAEKRHADRQRKSQAAKKKPA